MTEIDKTALSYWYPQIEAAGLPVPRTVFVPLPDRARDSLWALLDGKDAGDPKPFFATLKRVADGFGYPVFLRTDHTSGKHDWENTCFLKSAEDIPSHISRIVEYSEMANVNCTISRRRPVSQSAVRGQSISSKRRRAGT